MNEFRIKLSTLSIRGLLLILTVVAIFIGLQTEIFRYNKKRTVVKAIQDASNCWAEQREFIYKANEATSNGLFVKYCFDPDTGLKTRQPSNVSLLYVNTFNKEIISKIERYGLPSNAMHGVPSLSQFDVEMRRVDYVAITSFPFKLSTSLVVRPYPWFSDNDLTSDLTPEGSFFPVEYRKGQGMYFVRYKGSMIFVYHPDGTKIAEGSF